MKLKALAELCFVLYTMILISADSVNVCLFVLAFNSHFANHTLHLYVRTIAVLPLKMSSFCPPPHNLQYVLGINVLVINVLVINVSILPFAFHCNYVLSSISYLLYAHTLQYVSIALQFRSIGTINYVEVLVDAFWYQHIFLKTYVGYASPLTFRRRIKSRLPFAGIIRRLTYSTRFQDKG